MFTVGAELYTNSAANMDLLQSLGVGVVRLDMNWTAVAPDAPSLHKPAFDVRDPNAYPQVSWARYDAIIRGLTARHIGIDLALIGPPPLWAEGRGAPSRTTQAEWKPDAGAYADWVHAVGTRYSGHFTPAGASRPLPRIDFWSVWNEPNIGSNLAPETTHAGSAVEVAPGLYRDLLNGAWSSLQATGHGHDRILIGELAPAGATFKGAPGLFGAMAPLRFLRALYCVDANYRQLRGTQADERGCPTTPAASARFATQNPGLFKAPGFAVHPYGFTSLPPNVRIRNLSPTTPSWRRSRRLSRRLIAFSGSTARTRSSRSGRPSSATSPTRPTTSTRSPPRSPRTTSTGPSTSPGRTRGSSPSTIS